MDQVAFTVFLNLLTPPVLLLLLLLLLLVIYVLFPFSKTRRLPPGPKPWPVVGNILQLGQKLHVSLATLAKVHGPLISLRLGTQLVVVASSPMAATEIMKTQDRLLSGRKLPKAAPFEPHILNSVAIAWTSECTEEWKFLRALCRTELFSVKAVESQAMLREKKVGELVEFLRSREGSVVNVAEAVFATVFNILGNLLFSRDVISYRNEDSASGLKDLVWKIVELFSAPNIADFYSKIAWLDPQGLRRKLSKCVHELFATWELDIKRRRETQVSDSSKADFLDVFIANGFEDEKINWLFLELFIAGTDTTTSTVEWAMAELLKNKEAMKRACQELKTEIKTSPIKESHVSQLPYLNACLKETLRLHPPVPFLLPRVAAETCKIMSYTVPKNSQVLVNVWAMGRDPSVWEDPLSFKPERFLGTSLDFKGQHFELVPFGAGRRICPGIPMAARQVPLFLATMLHSFGWSLPNNEDPANLDMNDKLAITVQKEQPLLLIPRRL
ncbi:hypothetical protein K2173_008563 [Erythroxylum novogranatense]|uniref:(S)-N-methylcoclaurine 3'-hydroxylase isozyme 2 n=1 Tax=Erythroxylum novogranatense TaxID=1862640 RepID=A0AAV8SL91_9ROSI|nr:hypothetical protein K2173_008563 [Erythroxylum novogranatense]